MRSILHRYSALLFASAISFAAGFLVRSWTIADKSLGTAHMGQMPSKVRERPDIHRDIDSRHSREQPREQASRKSQQLNSESNFSSDPTEAIRQLVSKYSGRELETALMEAATYYKNQGTAAIRSFLLALPIGRVSGSAVKEVLTNVTVEESPAMTRWLAENSDIIGTHINIALDTVMRHWAKANLLDAIEFLASDPHLEITTAWRGSIASELLGTEREHSPTELLRIVDSLQNDALRRELQMQRPYIKAKLDSEGIQGVVVEVTSSKDEEFRKNSIHSLYSLLPDMSGKRSFMDAMVEVDYPERQETVARLARRWMQFDLGEGLAWVSDLQDKALVSSIVAESWETIAKAEPQAALEWLALIENEDKRREAERKLGDMISNQR